MLGTCMQHVSRAHEMEVTEGLLKVTKLTHAHQGTWQVQLMQVNLCSGRQECSVVKHA